jgi:hypothetical protein
MPTFFWLAMSALPWLAASVTPGLYGIDSGQRLAYYFNNGSSVKVGPGVNSSRYILADGLSTIDTSSATIFLIALDLEQRAPVLLSLPLATGVAFPVLQLPFFEDFDAIGAGQVMSFVPESGQVIVGGVGPNGSTQLATVDPSSKKFTAFANLPNNVSVALDTSQAVYFPSTRKLVILVVGSNPPYSRQFAEVTLQTGAVEYMPNGMNPRVDTIDFDPVTGDAFGLGTYGSTDDACDRVTVRLSASGLRASVVGTVLGYCDSLGGFSALDPDDRSLWWLAAHSGNDDGFYSLNIALDANASVLSAGLVCTSSLSGCPLTFEYYNHTAVALL